MCSCSIASIATWTSRTPGRRSSATSSSTLAPSIRTASSHGEHPERGSGGRGDPVAREALRACCCLRGERLGGQDGDRGEHPGCVRVAARLDRREHRGHRVGWQLGLRERDQHGRGELFQLGRVLERRRVVEDLQERRDDLLVQDL